MSQDFTILVLEDETPLLEAVKDKLENTGLSVATARTVAQGIRYLEELKKVDCIWLDHYLLGKESGLDFVAKMKEGNSKWRSIPIFVVSNTASTDKIQSYLHFGVNKFYTKSDYRLDQIISDIKNYLSSPEGRNE